MKLELLKLCVSYCDLHKAEILKMYCHDCQDNVCIMCFAIKHRQHNCQETEVVAKDFRQQMKVDDEALVARIDEMRRVIETLDKSRIEFLAQITQQEMIIKQNGEELKEEIARQVNKLLLELECVKTDNANIMALQRQRIELALTSMESFASYTEQLRKNGSDYDVVRDANDLHTRTGQLMESNVGRSDSYQTPQVTYKPGNLCDLLKKSHGRKKAGLVGEIIVTEITQVQPYVSSSSRPETLVDTGRTDETQKQYFQRADQGRHSNGYSNRQYDRQFMLMLQQSKYSTIRPPDLPNFDIILEQPLMLCWSQQPVEFSIVTHPPWSNAPSPLPNTQQPSRRRPPARSLLLNRPSSTTAEINVASNRHKRDSSE
jgi:hypothetical protein